MLAFHNDPQIKQKYVARVARHAKMDQIVKGRYWEGGKGCAIGCTIHSGNHADYEILLGIPRIIARLEDGIFESMPNELAMTWPGRFLNAITPGADLSLAWPRFAVWMLADEKNGVIRFAKTESSREAILSIATTYKELIAGQDIPVSKWKELRHAADDAAYADAYADAYAYADADADADAAAAYAADADAYAARIDTRITQSEKLLEILSACPVGVAV